MTKANACAIMLTRQDKTRQDKTRQDKTRQDQEPRLPSQWKCAHRLTLSGGGGTLRIRERMSRDPQMVKIFESIAGRTGCVKVLFADVQAPLSASLPSLFLWRKGVNKVAGCY